MPICNIKLLQDYQENQFSFVVVEDFDNIAAIRLFKRLRGVFNVALTRKKFTVINDKFKSKKFNCAFR